MNFAEPYVDNAVNAEVALELARMVDDGTLLLSHTAEGESVYRLAEPEINAAGTPTKCSVRHTEHGDVILGTCTGPCEICKPHDDCAMTPRQFTKAMVPQVPRPEDLSDDFLIAFYATILEERERVTALLDDRAAPIKNEIARRLRERRAAEPAATHTIAIPHQHVKCELEAQYGPYAFDIGKLQLAGEALPDAERAKLVTRMQEQIVIVPASTHPGNPQSILALQRKYAGSEVGDLLKEATSRPRLEDRLTIAPVRRALPKGGTA